MAFSYRGALAFDVVDRCGDVGFSSPKHADMSSDSTDLGDCRCIPIGPLASNTFRFCTGWCDLSHNNWRKKTSKGQKKKIALPKNPFETPSSLFFLLIRRSFSPFGILTTRRKKRRKKKKHPRVFGFLLCFGPRYGATSKSRAQIEGVGRAG